ncbi:hypothetical protein [uncultured Anaerococcus sp.]|uniref:hypothetical protein n=1 Tax=uncultured Anaerococcus sp. TaxID=293428 RepID=UPI0028064D15|nr:hypothetical protein [uncultured Anaerococcus sp.]
MTNSSKAIRIIVGIIWLIVAYFTYKQDQATYSVITLILGILFIVMAFRNPSDNCR